MASPTRSANSERPLSTASPDSVLPTMAEELGGDAGVEHDRQPLGRRLGRAQQTGGPVTASLAASSTSSSPG